MTKPFVLAFDQVRSRIYSDKRTGADRRKRRATKFAAASGLIVGVVILALLLLTSSRASDALNKSEEQQLTQLVTLLSNSAKAPLALHEPGERLQHYVDAVGPGLPSLEYVIIRNAGAEVVARWERSAGVAARLGERSTDTFAHKEELVRNQDGPPLGSLSLSMSRSTRNDAIGGFRIALCAGLAATVLLTFLLAAILRRLELKLEESSELSTAEMRGNLVRLEHLNKSKSAMIRKFGELLRGGLDPDGAELRELIDAGKRYAPEEVLRDNQTMAFVMDELEPLAQRAEAASGMHSKRVLLSASVKKIQRAMRTALLGTGVELDTPETPQACLALLEERAHDVICVDAEYLPLVLQCKNIRSDAKIVFLTDHRLGDALPLLKANKSITNLVSYDSLDLNAAIRSLQITVGKIVNNDLFGLEKYLSWGVEAQEIELTSSEDRHAAQDKMCAHFESIGVRKRFVNSARQAAEEMLMNAIYDAPTDPEGKALFNHLSRLEEVTLPNDDKVLFRYACDGLTLAVSVKDPYGSLGRDTIVDYLDRNYNLRPGHRTGEHKGGAGRGLFMLTEVSDLVVFNVEKGKRTEAIAFLQLASKDRGISAPKFHYFGA